MDLSFYKGKRVLVTGHTGFKGSWMNRVLLNAGAEVIGYSRCSEKNPSLFALSRSEQDMVSIRGDVRDYDALSKVFDTCRPEIVIHMAAQPIVRESYEQPLYTYETNVMGTLNVLECVRTHDCVKSVVNVTTDKVYENKERAEGYREDEPLDGFDPYSNSKSCSELVTHCYDKSFLKKYGVAVSTARAGNVIGGGDFARDRIIPDCVRAAEKGVPITVRNPYSTRPYQHVLEPVTVYLMLAAKQYEDPAYSGWYNVGPDDCDCVTTGELVSLFCDAWGHGLTWENHAEANAPHEANFLKLDSTKLKTTFGWSPCLHIADAVKAVCAWTEVYFAHGDCQKEMDRQIKAYLFDH